MSSPRKSLLATLFYLASLNAAPEVTGISPNTGSAIGGNPVTITGSGFIGTTTINFGPKIAPSFVVNSDNSITAIAPPDALGAVDVTVTTVDGTSGITRADVYMRQGSWILYVTENGMPGSIVPLQVPANILNAPIVLPVSNSDAITITKDNRNAVVVSSGANQIDFLDLTTNTVTGTLPVGIQPLFLVLTGDQQFVYVSNNGDGTVSYVNLNGTPSIIATIPVGGSPFYMVLTLDGKKLYVSNPINDRIDVVDTTTNTVVNTISVPTGSTPAGMTLSADGTELYVVNQGMSSVSRVDTTTDTIIGSPITVGSAPITIQLNFAGTHMYVPNLGSNSISVIDTATNTVSSTISGVPEPFRFSIAPNDQIGYVTNPSNNTVTPIDLITGNPLTAIPGFSTPFGESTSKDQSPLAVFNITPGFAGATTSFDASQSLSPTGTIATYAWDFGDSTKVTTTEPIMTHTYSTAGTYTVALAVTNSAGTSTAVLRGHTGSAFAALAQPVTIQPAPSTSVAAPKNFSGKIVHVFHPRHKHHLELHTEWDASPEQNIAYYEIFAHEKSIARIYDLKRLYFHKKIHLPDFFVEFLLAGDKSHYKIYSKMVHKKYKVRAVNSQGIKSAFTKLHLKKLS